MPGNTKSLCSRCDQTYDPKENAMGALGGHSPDECIAALKVDRDGWKKAQGNAVTMMDREEVRAKKLDTVLVRIALEAGVHCPDALPTRELESRVVLAIQGLKEKLPHPPNEGKTHWDGCHVQRGHHNCAVRHIQEMGESIAESNKIIEEIRVKMGIKPGDPLLGIEFDERMRPDTLRFKETLTVERKVNSSDKPCDFHGVAAASSPPGEHWLKCGKCGFHTPGPPPRA